MLLGRCNSYPTLHHDQVFFCNPILDQNCLISMPFLLKNQLDSSVGRALHRYRRDHGFESLLSLNFFQALFSQMR